jgi:transposase-like protein
MSRPAAKSPYAGHRFPAEVIGHAVWLYFRFPLSLRMVEEMLAARGIVVSHETVRRWALKFGQAFANRIRRRLPCAGDKWHLDEVAIRIAGVRHWLWRAVDQTGMVLDVLVQGRRDKRAAERLLRKLLKRQRRAPRAMITDKLASYGAARKDLMPRGRAPPAQGPQQPGGELVWGFRCQALVVGLLRECRIRARPGGGLAWDDPRGARPERDGSRHELVSGGFG